MKAISIAFLCMAALVISSCTNNEDEDEIKMPEDPSTIQTSIADSALIRGKWVFCVDTINHLYHDCINLDHKVCEFGKGNSWTISEEYEDKDGMMQSNIESVGRYVLLSEEGLLQLYKNVKDYKPYKTFYYKTDGNYLYLSENNKDFSLYQKMVDGILPLYAKKRTEELEFLIETKFTKEAEVINTISTGIETLGIPSNITYRGTNFPVTSISRLEGDFSYVSIPNTMKRIYSIHSSNLEEIEIPNSVVKIGGGCFSGLEKLKKVKLPDGIESLSDGTFHYCTSLEAIEIPNSVKSIGKECFANAYMLKNVKLPDELESIGESAFWFCESITSISIPDKVTNIGAEAFVGCTTKTLSIPDKVTNIGNGAFSGCGITTLFIGSAIEKIGNGAFGEDKIEIAYCSANNPPVIYYNTFDSDAISPDAILYVPSESVEKYKTSEFSKFFKNIESMQRY